LYPDNPSVWLVALAWSLSGDRILTGTRDGSVTLWDAASGEELYTMRGHRAEISSDWSVAWSPDGRRVATGSVDGTAMIWDTAPVFTLEGHADIVHAFWSPTDDRILSGSIDGIAKIWDARAGAELLKVYGADIPLGENWSPSGDRFSIGVKTGETKIWDATSGERLLTLFIPGYSGRDKRWSVPAWSPDGTRIATGYDYGAFVNIWDATSGEELMTVRGFTHERSETFWVEWSPSGDRILTVDEKEFVKVWDATTGEKVLDISDFENVVPIADWSPDGSRIATLTYENDGAIWDAQSGGKLAEFYGHQGSTFGLRWSPSGERLVTGSYDGTVRVWDADSGQQVLHYPIGYKINKVDWSHDGSKLLITYADSIIVLPVWQTTQELIDYAHECCVVRDLTPEDRELYGLPPEEE
jgi:WD40 repeat protein